MTFQINANYFLTKIENAFVDLDDNNPYSKCSFKYYFIRSSHNTEAIERKLKDSPLSWISNENEKYKFLDLFDIESDFKIASECFRWNETKPETIEIISLIDVFHQRFLTKKDDIKLMEQMQFNKAKEEWAIRNKDLIEEDEIKMKHKDHKPLSYYLEKEKYDPDMKLWYERRGGYPTNELTCHLCKKKAEEQVIEYPSSSEEEVEEPVVKKAVANKTYRCDLCELDFNNFTAYTAHSISQEHNTKSTYCKICDVQFSCISQYDHHKTTTKHKKMCEGNNEPISYVCNKCNYTTFIKQNYDKHMLSKKHMETIVV
jgi:hypothetical protein